MLFLSTNSKGQTIAETSAPDEFTKGDVIWCKVYEKSILGYVRRPRFTVLKAYNTKDGQRLILEDYKGECKND